MLRRSCAVLLCAVALALPARAVETVPAATSTPAAKAPENSSIKLYASRKSGKHNAHKHRRKLAASGAVKARRAGAAKKPGQKAASAAVGSPPAKLSQVKPKKMKSAAPKSQHAKHRTAPEYTGSVAPRSVPTPGLY